MRYYLLTISFLLFAYINFGQGNQSDQIIKLALSDTANFKIMKTLNGGLPKKFIILDSTKKWNTQIFILENIDLENPEIKRQMDSGTYKKYNAMYRNSYCDPYHRTYLFTDSMLKLKINKGEQIKLQETAARLKSKKIYLLGQNYFTISNYKQVNQGYFLRVSEPIFSADKNHAFISFDIYKRDPELKQETVNQCYFGNVTIAYEKQQNNIWRRIALKDDFIL